MAPEGVSEMLRSNGLPCAQMLLFVDCTKSNETSGAASFGGRSLHDVTPGAGAGAGAGAARNPYQQTLSAVGRALWPLDPDGLVALYGFGDQATADQRVFNFLGEGDECFEDLEALLRGYEQVIPTVRLAGPTSFVPAIKTATQKATDHGDNDTIFIAVLIADGAPNNRAPTEAALREAARLPIAVVCVGVGDGPWQPLQKLEADLRDAAGERGASNFRFVEHAAVVRAAEAEGKDADTELALAALSGIPALLRHLRATNVWRAAGGARKSQRTRMY